MKNLSDMTIEGEPGSAVIEFVNELGGGQLRPVHLLHRGGAEPAYG